MSAVLDYSVSADVLTATAAAITVPAPVCAPGCVLVLAAASGTAGVTAQPLAGWALNTPGSELGVYTRTADASDAGAAYTVAFSGPASLAAAVACLPPGTTVDAVSVPAAGGSAAVTYSPPVPQRVKPGQVVLLAAAARVDPGDASGSADLRLPDDWAWEVPPIGPAWYAPVGAPPPAVGLASFAGQPAAAAMSAAPTSEFAAAFLVITPGGDPGWVRVTARAGGDAGTGTALTVTVLNGAALRPGAATGKSATAPAVTLTPGYTGSLLLGAVYEEAAGTPFTPAAGTAFAENWAIASPPAAHGTFSAGPATAGQAMTAGASAPAPAGGVNVAVAEFAPAAKGGTVTQAGAASGRGRKAGDYRHPVPTADAVLTTPPASGQVLVATVSQGYHAPATWLGDPRLAVSDSSGLRWTEIAASAGPGYAGVWAAAVP